MRNFTDKWLDAWEHKNTFKKREKYNINWSLLQINKLLQESACDNRYTLPTSTFTFVEFYPSFKSNNFGMVPRGQFTWNCPEINLTSHQVIPLTAFYLTEPVETIPLVDSKIILPEEARIDLDRYNWASDTLKISDLGLTLESARLLLIRYHKALISAEQAKGSEPILENCVIDTILDKRKKTHKKENYTTDRCSHGIPTKTSETASFTIDIADPVVLTNPYKTVTDNTDTEYVEEEDDYEGDL